MDQCLNPCFNGICSASLIQFIPEKEKIESLNPCFNGICSASARTTNSRGFEKAS